MTLIGTIDFRKGWFGGLMLQVEEEVKGRFTGKAKRRWRRATLMDLAQPELRILVDMRTQAHGTHWAPLRSVPTGGSASSYARVPQAARA
jgi:hypothetical protein